MGNERNSAPVLTAQGAQGVSLVTPTVPQQVLQSQVQNIHKSGNSKKERHTLGYHSTVYTVALKFYGEQVVAGAAQDAAGLIARIKAIDPKWLQVLAICHNKDEVTDGIWAVAAVKPHWHVIVRCTDRTKRVKVNTVLNTLGIHYRPGLDDELWTDHGVETVGNFTGYAMYLTHETEEAIRDAKERYDVSEIISNLTPEEVEQIRAGYIRVSENRKVTAMELVSLDKEAYDLGYAMGNFSEWYDRQPFNVRSNAKMKTIRESYIRGVDARVEQHTELVRLCIYIQGAGNVGKSYNAKVALQDKRILPVKGGGTGKFDNLRPDHEAIIIDDDVCPNLLNMTDNYVCRAYRRQSNNPVWAGKYFIVTSNKSFEQWCTDCGIQVLDECSHETDTFRALKSRFFICEIRNNGGAHLSMVSPSLRGSAEAQAERRKMFEDFISRFNASIRLYDTTKISIPIEDIMQADYSAYWDDIDDYEAREEARAEEELARLTAQEEAREAREADEIQAQLDAHLARKKAQGEAKQRSQKDAGTTPIIRNYG